MAEAKKFQQNSGTLLREKIIPLIRDYFDTLDVNDRIIRFEKLSVEWNTSGAQLENEDLQPFIEHQLKNTMDVAIRQKEKNQPFLADANFPESDQPPQFLTPHQKSLQSFIHFLKTGTAAWWVESNHHLSQILEESSLIRLLSKTDEMYAPVKKAFASSAAVRKRCIRQFSDEFLGFLFTSFQEDSFQRQAIVSEKQKKALHQLETLDHTDRMAFWLLTSGLISEEGTALNQKNASVITIGNMLQKLLSFHSIGTNNKKELNLIHQTALVLSIVNKKAFEKTGWDDSCKNIAHILSAHPPPHTHKRKHATDFYDPEGVQHEPQPDKSILEKIHREMEDPIPSSKQTEHAYIENAGLVLTSPFLKPLFQKLNLLTDQGELSEKTKAVGILHYAATGKTSVFEHELMFEKYLCGISMEQSIPKQIQLHEDEKYEVDQLLSAMLKHWNALRTTSIDLLRHEFLSRPGKFITDEISPRIVIEKKTIDILLDKLPWSVSMIRIPWKKEIIYVEW